MLFDLLDYTGQLPSRVMETTADADASVFVLSLADFDQPADPDAPDEGSRLDEAIALFHRHIKFRREGPDAVIFVLLNKRDLLEEKLRTRRFADFAPDYDGDNDAASCIQYVQDQLHHGATAHYGSNDVPIFFNALTATDRERWKHIWNALQTSILERQLSQFFLI